MRTAFSTHSIFLITVTIQLPIFQPRLFAQSMTFQQGLREYHGVTELSNGLALRFDISALPRDAIVHSARLNLYPSLESLEEVSVYKILVLREPLDSQGKPGMADSIAMLDLRPGTLTWVALDLAPTVRTWHGTPTTNHGLAFQPLTEAARIAWFSSSSEDKVHRPRLIVDYTTVSSGPLSISLKDAARICMCLRGRLTIQRSGAFAPVSWMISSLDGKQIRPPLTNATAEKAHLDMRGYPKGLYHVILRNQAGQALQTKIMVD